MKISLQTIVPALLAYTFAFAVSAQDVTAPAEVDALTKAKAARSIEAAGNRDRIADRHCLRATGSRIVVMRNAKADQTGKRCAIGPGRVHTSEDLERPVGLRHAVSSSAGSSAT